MPNPHVGKKSYLEVPADLYFSAVIRDFAKDIFRLAGFDEKWQNKLKLVVDELFMNAVKYGSNEKNNVYLIFEILADGVFFSIEDTGTGEKGCSVEELKRKIEDQKKNTNLAKTSGRGLAMFTSEWSDLFEVTKSEHGGTKISFKKYTGVADKEKKEIFEKPKFEKKSKQITLKFVGDIDQFNMGEKIEVMEEALKKITEDTELIIDFSEVTYINSVFIGNLANLYTQLEKKKSRLKITGANEMIHEILDLVGLTKIVEIERLKS